MKTKNILSIVSVIFILLVPFPAFAAEPLILDINFKKSYIGLQTEYLVDTDKTITIEQITSRSKADTYTWIQPQEDRLSFGFTENVYWIRFTVENKSINTIEWYLHQEYPLIDYINLYIPGGKKTFKKIETGDQFIFSERPINYRSFVFPLMLKPRTSQTCYMRFESSSAMNIHLIAWPPPEFKKFKETETIILWIFYAIMGTMFLYNLFIFSSVKEIQYLYYILYILTFTLFVMTFNSMAFQYLWPHSITWSNLSVPFFIGLTNYSIIQFCRYSAEVWTFMKKWEDMSLRFLMITGISLSALTLIINNYRFSITAVTILTFMSASLGSYLILKYGLIVKQKLKLRQMRFLFIAFMFFLTGVILHNLKTFAMLPSNIITEYSILIGTVMEVFLFSFALADRINVMKNQMADLNQNLEVKVAQRTDELEAMNYSLIELNNQFEKAQYISAMDMKMAIAVQTALLPGEPPQAPGWDIAFYFKPMSGVSGDLYDFYEENGTLQGLALMDVSGHGIASALITMIARSVINRNVMTKSTYQLNEVLEEINKDLINEIGEADNYLTGIILRFKENTVEYVNAAHPELLHRQGGSKKVTTINNGDQDTRGMFLGMYSVENSFEQITFDIANNDSLLLFSDCLIESENLINDSYKTSRILESFEKAPDDTAREILDYILKDFFLFVGEKDLKDDLTIIVAKRTE